MYAITEIGFYLFVATLIDFTLAKRSLILKQKINWENIHTVTIITLRYNDQLNLKQQKILNSKNHNGKKRDTNFHK